MHAHPDQFDSHGMRWGDAPKVRQSSVTPPDWQKICARWHQATVANSLTQWHALAEYLAGIAIMCAIDAMPDAEDSTRTLSDLALQRAFDLQPEAEAA